MPVVGRSGHHQRVWLVDGLHGDLATTSALPTNAHACMQLGPGRKELESMHYVWLCRRWRIVQCRCRSMTHSDRLDEGGHEERGYRSVEFLCR